MARHIWLFAVFLIIPSVFCDDCITYNFENDFEELFSNEIGICSGMMLWELGNYSSIAVDSPNANSESFISPSTGLSCVSSFSFSMKASGAVDVNVYMEATSPSDVLSIMVNKISGDGADPVVGSMALSGSDPTFVSGWQVLRIPLSGVGTYDGYISILGIASEESTVLIDSFRYIPPSMDAEDCVLYDNDITEDATTDPIDTTTGSPLTFDEDCVTYNFEWDFNSLFNDATALCDEYTSWNHWNYTSLSIDSPDTNSELFISPNTLPSCISSFEFTMTPRGVVEANVYMEPKSELDYIIVLAKKVVPNSIHTVAGFYLYYPSSEQFVPGWNTLRFSVDDFRPFDGYLTFIGTAAEGSVILIDSFRYMSPTALEDEDSCAVY